MFALKKIEAIEGKQRFFELLIDGKSEYDEFTSELIKNPQYYSELKTMLAYMSMVAEMRMLPRSKFRDITPTKENVKEYEFKTKHLRVYAFHLEKTGKIVTVWGYKSNQNKDMRRFRSIKKRYLKTI